MPTHDRPPGSKLTYRQIAGIPIPELSLDLEPGVVKVHDTDLNRDIRKFWHGRIDAYLRTRDSGVVGAEVREVPDYTLERTRELRPIVEGVDSYCGYQLRRRTRPTGRTFVYLGYMQPLHAGGALYPLVYRDQIVPVSEAAHATRALMAAAEALGNTVERNHPHG